MNFTNFFLQVPVDGPPTMDLFKAIFQDSDSDTDDESREADNTKTVDKNDEAKQEAANILPQKSTALDDSGRNVSTVTAVQENSGSRFFSSVKNDQEKKDKAEAVPGKSKIDGGRKRISRFEPQAEVIVPNTQHPNCPSLESSFTTQDSALSTEDSSFRADLPKPVFIPKKKESLATKPTPSRGIFADVDFNALNSQWNTDASSSQESPILNVTDQVPPNPAVKGAALREVDSDSSTDPENEYGPAVPSHLRHQAQMVRSDPVTSVDVIQKLGEKQRGRLQNSKWVEKIENKVKKATKKHKHRDRHKHKKEKKKKDKKNKSHKEKKKKKKKQRHISSSSSSESSSESSQ